MLGPIPAVLVIDNNSHSRHEITEALQIGGYDVTAAEDIASAIWIACDKNLPLDIVICDSEVGEQTGSQVIEAIHSVDGRTDLPVIFTSARQTADVILKQHRARGAYSIRKPYDSQLLLELMDRSLWMPHLVNSHIEKHHSAQPLASPHAVFGGVSYPTAINTSAFAVSQE